MTQFYSRNDVNYSGDVYSIPFDYIDKKEVKVYIDDELWTKWHFLSEHQLTLDEVPEDIRYSNIVSVRRETNIEDKVVTYDNNSLLNKENLNKSQDQLLYAVQEIYDNNTQFAIDIRAEVDEKVERVSEAVEKLDIIDASVETSVQKAQEATEQAQLATEKAEETLNTYNEAMAEIDTLRQDSVDEVNQLVADYTDDLNALDQLIKKDADAIINRVGWNMFDTVVKDHILTYEESKGLALQGTWVYKDAIAGERYGYPDFYNKCLEEYNDSASEKLYFKSNVNKVGSVSDTQGVLSGFSTANYATLPNHFAPASNPWEFGTKITTGNWSTNNVIIGCTSAFKSGLSLYISGSGVLTLSVSSNGTAWDISNAVTGSTLNVNTEYWFKVEFTGSAYNVYYSTNGVTWNLDITVNNSTVIYQGSYYWVLGGGVIGGTTGYYNTVNLNLNESYININGERWWTGADTFTRNPNGHMFYDISQKIDIDNIFVTTGMAWMYGIDQENERIFLPRNNWFEQFGDVDDVGKAIEAGLPNITGAIHFSGIDGWAGSENAFYQTLETGAGRSHNGNSSNCGVWFRLDASRSSKVYSKSNTVQPNAVKKLLYICVGNQMQDTSWVDVVTQVANGAKDIEDKRVQALTDLNNKENAGLSALANASNALRTTQITNCLLEVPQNIKLELNDGVLTLKAGSKVIVPNGGVFDEVTVSQDINYTYTHAPTQNSQCMLFIKNGTRFVSSRLITSCVSGNTKPTGSYINWYNTTENLMYSIAANNTVDNSGFSFPIAIITQGSDGVTKSIDQIFNGFGYIGSTIWVDKGVKGLKPKGRNADGSLNNTEIITTSVKTRTVDSNNGDWYVAFNPNITWTSLETYGYDEEQNMTLSGGGAWSACVFGRMQFTNGKITSFQPKQPFRAVDQNEFNNTPHITETYVNGTSWYRVYSDGWCEQGGYISSGVSGVANGVVVTFLKPFLNSNYTITMLSGHTDTSTNNLAVQYGNSYYGCYQPSSKTAKTIRLCGNGTWHACGYIV